MEVIAIIFAVVPAIIWLVIGWRAMRAHERIAKAVTDAAEEWAFVRRRQRLDQPRPGVSPESGPAFPRTERPPSEQP